MNELNDHSPEQWDVDDVVRDLLSGPDPTPDVVATGRAMLLDELYSATPQTGTRHSDPHRAAGRHNGRQPTQPHLKVAPLVEPHHTDRRHAESAQAASRHDDARHVTTPVSGRRSARRRPRRGRLAVALAGGALAVGAVFVATAVVVLPDAPRPGTSQSAIPRPAARQILLAAADAIATAPAEGEYWRIRQLTTSMMIEPGRAYVLQRRLSEERWLARRTHDQGWRITRDLGTTPATPEDEAAWRTVGSPSSWQYSADTAGLNATSNEKVTTAPAEPQAARLTGTWQGSGGTLLFKPMTWAELGKIPSEPEELRAYLEKRIEAKPGSAGLEPRLREACMQILRGLAVSPDVRAGAYRLLATLPGMRADGEVADPLGRRGQALSYEVEASPGQTTEVRFVVDPRTGLPLALETTSPGTLADGRTVQLRHSTSYEAIGWTDDKPAPRG
ncbi:CU044_5270 family protein [Nonomuraea sp. NPDC051941]|uniref:CU044_5270 family protein n=1 Tax=Nonomuraea sp. NPDC051941 TaxID=3364373 RepID=UPI0037C70217